VEAAVNVVALCIVYCGTVCGPVHADDLMLFIFYNYISHFTFYIHIYTINQEM